MPNERVPWPPVRIALAHPKLLLSRIWIAVEGLEIKLLELIVKAMAQAAKDWCESQREEEAETHEI